MARVDSTDDGLHRWVLWHFRYDAARRERRNVEVAAFDNEAEFMSEFRRLHAELTLRKQLGEAEAVENVSGVHKEPGHDDRQRRQRIELKARGRWHNARIRLQSKRAK